jgi:hypothetical protein
VLQLLALPAIVIDVHWAAWAVGVVGVVSFVSIVDYSVALWNARERA